MNYIVAFKSISTFAPGAVHVSQCGASHTCPCPYNWGPTTCISSTRPCVQKLGLAFIDVKLA